jgi:hypothetical protein
MRNVLIFLLIVAFSFTLNFVSGQGINCYTVASLGTYTDYDLDVIGSGYYCCYDSVELELYFYVDPDVEGEYLLECPLYGTQDVSIQANSEYYSAGYHSEFDRGYSGEMTRDSLALLGHGDTGHFKDIRATATYFE